MRPILIAFASAVMFVAASCSASTASPDPPVGSGEAQVTEIRSIDDLRAAFNEDAGSTRLVLSMSPT